MIPSTKKQTQLQVTVPQDLAEQAQAIFQALGLTTQAAMTIFLKKVVATKGIPFSVQLTERQKSTLNLRDAVAGLPVKELKTEQELEKWFADNEY